MKKKNLNKKRNHINKEKAYQEYCRKDYERNLRQTQNQVIIPTWLL